MLFTSRLFPSSQNFSSSFSDPVDGVWGSWSSWSCGSADAQGCGSSPIKLRTRTWGERRMEEEEDGHLNPTLLYYQQYFHMRAPAVPYICSNRARASRARARMRKSCGVPKKTLLNLKFLQLELKTSLRNLQAPKSITLF